MSEPQHRIRNTFLTGIFAAVPLAVTGWILWQADVQTRALTDFTFHRRVPFAGILIALLIIYALGMLVNSLVGKLFLRAIDGVLSRLPVLRELYTAWKQIALTPGGTEGTFSKVVLLPASENSAMRIIGFTSGRPLENDPTTWCVFVPAAPNPISGRLFFARIADCQLLDMSAEDAFKIILSGGNFIPPELGRAMAKLPTNT